MPPKSLHKVQKSIARKHRANNHNSRTSSTLHTNSRDAKRLQRAAARNTKLARTLSAHQKAHETYRKFLLSLNVRWLG